MTWNTFIVALVLFVSSMAYAVNFETHIIEDKKIDESSGVAASNYNPELLWTHNDSGDAPIIYPIGKQGKQYKSVFLEGIVHRDWEDMASFRLQEQGYLLIADSGDNFGLNLSSYIHIFKEPQIGGASGDPVSRRPAWSIEYNYEDGNLYDVEAVAVDTHNEKIMLLSKSPEQVQVFELPLFPGKENKVLSAKKIAQIDYLNYPTAMDISASGKLAAILSYGRVYLFHKKARQAWSEVLQNPDNIIKFSGLYQPEALCIDKSEKRLFITSEKLPAKLLTIRLP